jgi:hypothetical protein
MHKYYSMRGMYTTGMASTSRHDVNWRDCPWDEQELEEFYDVANEGYNNTNGFDPVKP